MDLNHRPHPYQGCALTELSYGPRKAAGRPATRRRHPIVSALGDANRPPDFSGGLSLRLRVSYLPLSPRPEMISSFGLAPTI